MSEKEYKYPLKIDDDMVVTGRIYSDAGRLNQEIKRNGRKGIWKPVLGVRKKDLKQTKLSASFYGELIAHLMQKKAGIPSCDVEILMRNIKIPRSASGRTSQLPGCISYYDFKDDEDLVQAINILAWYKETHYEDFVKIMDPLGLLNPNDYALNVNNEDNNNNIELIIPAFESYARERCHASDSQIDELRQQLIDMVVYDCIFGNNDRHSQNWGMFVDSKSGRIQMYPLYDNERVLGLSFTEAEVKKAVQGKDLQNQTETLNFSRMGTAPTHSGISYRNMLSHLVARYPEYAIPSIKKITDRVTVKDVEDLYNASEGIVARSKFADELSEADELPKEYKTFGLALYSERRNFARNLLEKHKSVELDAKESDDLVLV